MQRIVLLAILGFTLFSCDVLNSSDNLVELTSDQENYLVGETVTIALKNNSRNTIYFIRRCDLSGETESVAIEEKIDGTWQDGKRPLGCAGIVPPIEIQPGEKHLFEAVFNQPGVYRYRLGIYQTVGGEGLLPENQRRSNPFTIRRE